jgi:hypothetical protein
VGIIVQQVHFLKEEKHCATKYFLRQKLVKGTVHPNRNDPGSGITLYSFV